MSQQPVRRSSTPILGAFYLTLLTVSGWLRADRVSDDRGSDSSEKAFMIILSITLGMAVTVAAVAFVATKTALFK